MRRVVAHRVNDTGQVRVSFVQWFINQSGEQDWSFPSKTLHKIPQNGFETTSRIEMPASQVSNVPQSVSVAQDSQAMITPMAAYVLLFKGPGELSTCQSSRVTARACLWIARNVTS